MPQQGHASTGFVPQKSLAQFRKTFCFGVSILQFMLLKGALYVTMRHNWATASGPKLP